MAQSLITTRVNLGERSYDIQIGSGNLAGLAPFIRERCQASHAVIITDDAVDGLYADKLGDQLTDDEWVQMKLHPVYSADVINRFASYPDGVPLVRGHHESIDGTGYPDGLKGDAIPIGARILAVADTFDAITSDRPYRSGMPVHRAVEILNDGREKQWE